MIKYWTLFLGLVGLDQFSKGWILNWSLGSYFPEDVTVSVFLKQITSFFNLVMTKNTGVSFSFFSSSQTQIPLIILTGLISLWLVRWLKKETDGTVKIAILFILGGAIGNLIDRIRFAGVIDFLDFHYSGFHWPAFNLADIWISVGAGILVLLHIIYWKKKS